VIRQRNQLRIRRLHRNIINMSKILKSYDEAEQLTGLSRDRLQFLIESGQIKVTRPSRNQITFDLHDLVKDLESLDVPQVQLLNLAVKDQ
jgi:hypothetical protein